MLTNLHFQSGKNKLEERGVGENFELGDPLSLENARGRSKVGQRHGAAESPGNIIPHCLGEGAGPN